MYILKWIKYKKVKKVIDKAVLNFDLCDCIIDDIV